MRLYLAAAALVLVVSNAAAQEETVEPTVFGEVVDVSITSVDVVVTDRDGRPVKGLRPEDFELYEDGEPVEIVNFYAVEDGRRLPEPDAETQDAVVQAAGPSPASPGAPPQFLLVYVDNIHLTAGHRDRVLEALRAFLADRNSKGDRILIAAYDGAVEDLVEFTDDWEEIDAALRKLAVNPAFGHTGEDELRRVMENLLALRDTHNSQVPSRAATPCPLELGSMAEVYAKRIHQDLRDSIAAMSQTVASLASLPGRKAFLHVSDGLPLVAGAEVYEFLFQLCGAGGSESAADNSALTARDAANAPDLASERGEQPVPTLGNAYDPHQAPLDAARYDATDLYRELTTLANSHDVTFFTLDAAGPRNLSAATAVSGDQRMHSRRVDTTHNANLQDSLTFVAQRTGGQAILNTVDFAGALARVGDDLDTYYSLGYRSADPSDEKVYAIEVKVRREGTLVRFRDSLRTKPLAEQVADRTRGALLFGLEDNPLSVEIEVGEMRAMDSELSLVPLRIKIPLGKLEFFDQRDESGGHLSLFVTTRDSLGRLAPVRSQRIPLRIPATDLERAKKSVYVYEVRLMMRQGAHSVAVGVRDDLAAVASYVTEDVFVYAR